MKRLIASLLAATLLAGSIQLAPKPSVAQGQSVVVALGIVMMAGAGCLLVYVLDHNASQLQMMWVVMERGRIGGPWAPCSTNKIPVTPKRISEALPAYYVYVTNHNGGMWFRVRLAESWEIPPGYCQEPPGQAWQPIRIH